jgi:hypothetical protein
MVQRASPGAHEAARDPKKLLLVEGDAQQQQREGLSYREALHEYSASARPARGHGMLTIDCIGKHLSPAGVDARLSRG